MPKDLTNFTVDRTDSIRTAMLKITANRARVVVVLDGRTVVGTVSDGDIRRALLRDVLPVAPVEKVMNINCKTTMERDPRRLADIARRERVTVLPIVDASHQLLDVFTAYEPTFEGEPG